MKQRNLFFIVHHKYGSGNGVPDVSGITVSIPAAHESEIILSKIQEKNPAPHTLPDHRLNKKHLKIENRSEDLPVTYWS